MNEKEKPSWTENLMISTYTHKHLAHSVTLQRLYSCVTSLLATTSDTIVEVQLEQAGQK